MLTTNQKGALAEAAVAKEAIRLGIGVFKPLADERCDFVFDLRPQLVRVQCKWASRRGDVIGVPLYSARRASDGLRRLRYGRDDVDAFAAYCPDNDRCYFFDFEPQVFVHLRLAPTRNNQTRGIRWARDYEFAARLSARQGP